MFFGHEGLEIGRGEMLWTALTLPPFHEEAVGDPPIHSQDQHAFVALDAATIVVVRNIQPLMKATLDAPALAVEMQPLGSLEPLRRSTGDQGHFFIFATLGLAQQTRRLMGQRKADILRTNGRSANDPVFRTALVVLLRTSLSRRRFIWGENPLAERRPCSECGPAEWAGSSWQ